MSIEIINKLNSPRLAMMVEQGIHDALASRRGEDWWVGVFEFDARRAFQIVMVGPGLAWNGTFPKEDALEMRAFISHAATSAIEALRFLRADPRQTHQIT